MCPLLFFLFFLRIWRIPLFTYQVLFSWLSYKDEWQNKAEGRILQKRHSGRCQSFLLFSLSCLKASGCLETELQCCSRKWLYLKWTQCLVSDFLFIFLALHVCMCAEMDLKDLKAVSFHFNFLKKGIRSNMNFGNWERFCVSIWKCLVRELRLASDFTMPLQMFVLVIYNCMCKYIRSGREGYCVGACFGWNKSHFAEAV